jgi:hypothetical protein
MVARVATVALVGIAAWILEVAPLRRMVLSTVAIWVPRHLPRPIGYSLPVSFAVALSRLFNLADVSTPSGTVTFGAIYLLPVELVGQAGTWTLGLSASSSNSQDERPTLWRREWRRRSQRTAKWPAGWER